MYELLKQLKDVGFPQKGNGGYLKQVMSTPANWGRTFTIYEPTTDELIEECSQFPRQFSLYGREYDRWEATIVGTKFVTNEETHYDKPSVTVIGKTPKEALIKLYLELHKK